MSEKSYDLIVIGSGTGGYSTALRASELGMSVALIERDSQLGGTCLNRGCIPTKALITAAHTVEATHAAATWGITTEVSSIDVDVLNAQKTKVVNTMVKGLTSLVDARGVEVIHGEATLIDSSTVEVVGADEGTETGEATETSEATGAEAEKLVLTATDIVVATGSHPRPLPYANFGDYNDRVISSNEALNLNEIPTHPVIIGAGSIALEFASYWNAMGADVTLLIRKAQVFSASDKHATSALMRGLKRSGIKIVTNSAVHGIEENPENPSLPICVNYSVTDKKGAIAAKTIEADYVLGAIGRDPNTQASWFTQVGIELDERGFVKTDAYGRTNVEHVWAVGDIRSGNLLAHRAFQHGIVVAETIAGIESRAVEESLVPRITYSTPEFASIGLTMQEAQEDENLTDVKETVVPLLSNARVVMSGVSGSETLVTAIHKNTKSDSDNKSTRIVVGMHITGPQVSELIAQGQQLIGNAIPVHDAASLIQPHPTISEVVGEALLKADERPLHLR